MNKITLLFSNCSKPNNYYLYQKYYLSGLNQLDNISVNLAGSNKFFALLSDYNLRGVNKAWNLRAKFGVKKTEENNVAGRYIFSTPSSIPVKVAVDATDGGGINDIQAHEWADIYFKANKSIFQ